MTDREISHLRKQLAAARARAEPPALTLDQIRAALAEHIRFEHACGHGNTADRLAIARDQISAIGMGRP